MWAWVCAWCGVLVARSAVCLWGATLVVGCGRPAMDIRHVHISRCWCCCRRRQQVRNAQRNMSTAAAGSRHANGHSSRHSHNDTLDDASSDGQGTAHANADANADASTQPSPTQRSPRRASRREPNGRGGHGGRGGDTRRPGTGDGASTGVEGGVGHLQDLQLLSTDMAAATRRHAERQAAMNKRARIRARVRGRICCACVPVCSWCGIARLTRLDCAPSYVAGGCHRRNSPASPRASPLPPRHRRKRSAPACRGAGRGAW